MENNKKLDGVWKNDVFKVKIKGNTYVSYYNNSRYGKGKIIYDNENFVLTSTHARWLFFWTPFVEVVKGEYIITNEELTVSGIEGRYNDYNGTWTCVKK
jgi:fibronectin type 3 domain-containing protein